MNSVFSMTGRTRPTPWILLSSKGEDTVLSTSQLFLPEDVTKSLAGNMQGKAAQHSLPVTSDISEKRGKYW